MARMIVLLLVVAVMLPACETLNRRNQAKVPVADLETASNDAYTAPLLEEGGLRLSTSQRFKDIPLPVGLKEDQDRSFVYESATLQIGRMVYSSRSTINELVQFFIRECPTADWAFINVLESNGKLLVFKKPGKRMEVLVQDTASLPLSAGRRIVITLTPDVPVGATL
ncbi:MAG: hypothetical protein GWP08_08810 [Nitrospiraceae bacterium]|nr:hypothetical protein [Nitrospiraceae bacterium]